MTVPPADRPVMDDAGGVMPMERTTTRLLDFQPETRQFLDDVLKGLLHEPKRLPCKYLYDERGSKLFDRICELEEYYPTRTEAAIMERHVDEIVALFRPNAALIEYGSGSSTKTRILLDKAHDLAAYVPVDISYEHLQATAARLAKEYPNLQILPVCADYTRPFELPTHREKVSRRIVYFPGSTIGNFDPGDARIFFEGIARLVEHDGGLLIGVDLKKDVEILEDAYNDSEGITSEFNRNILRRINRELDADFDMEQFVHSAVYNHDRDRIELHLVSLTNQTIRVADRDVSFEEGETIHTENSYKYSLESFAQLAATADFTVEKVWTDPERLFSVQYLSV